MEVEAVDEGKILKILVPGGSQGIKVNAPIAILAGEGEENMSADAAMAALNKKGNGNAAPSAAAPAGDKEALADIRATVSSMMQEQGSRIRRSEKEYGQSRFCQPPRPPHG